MVAMSFVIRWQRCQWLLVALVSRPVAAVLHGSWFWHKPKVLGLELEVLEDTYRYVL
jgi:hypothetical protein